MAYTSAQLRAAYSAQHIGLAPSVATGAALDAAALETTAGTRTDISARALVINGADADTAVATLTYQFFTGAAPSAAGLTYLVNSAQNPTDLNDAYYQGFNLENRYINFASNLGVVGQGATAFAATYGAVTFTQAVDLAYEKIIGSTYAAAVGLSAAAGKADIVSRLPYFTALADQNFAGATAAQKDLVIKAEAAGYIMAEAMKADVGVYAAAMNQFSLGLIDGDAKYGMDLVVGYPSTPATVRAVGDRGPVTLPDGTIALGGGDNIYNAGDGANVITAGAGNNTITAGNGGNTITTGSGNNTITTGTGADRITTGAGNDTISAGDGANVVDGGAGNNTVTTGTGDDLITSGIGNATLTSGAGVDTLVLGGSLGSTDTLDGGAGIDTLKVTGLLADAAFAQVSNIEVLDLTGAAVVTLGAAAMTAGIRTVTNSGGGGVTVDAGGFTVGLAITGGAGIDTLSGGTGVDRLTGGGGVDVFNGAAGSDVYVFTDVDADTDVALTAVTDVIAGGFIAGADSLDFTVAGSLANYQENLVAEASLAAFSAAADGALNGTVQYYFGVVAGDGYLAMDVDGVGVTAIVRLAGVVDLAFGDIG